MIAKLSGLTALARISRFGGQILGGGGIKESWKDSKLGQEDPSELKRQLNEADKDGVTQSQKYTNLLREELSLLQQQRDVRNDINDRGKTSVDQMASEYQAITGLKLPRHTVTAKMRESFRIKQLYARAEIAFQHGDDAAHDRFMSEHDRLLAAGAFTARDRNPTQKQTEHLQEISSKLNELKPQADMARMVMQQAHIQTPGNGR